MTRPQDDANRAWMESWGELRHIKSMSEIEEAIIQAAMNGGALKVQWIRPDELYIDDSTTNRNG